MMQLAAKRWQCYFSRSSLVLWYIPLRGYFPQSFRRSPGASITMMFASYMELARHVMQCHVKKPCSQYHRIILATSFHMTCLSRCSPILSFAFRVSGLRSIAHSAWFVTPSKTFHSGAEFVSRTTATVSTSTAHDKNLFLGGFCAENCISRNTRQLASFPLTSE